MAAGGDEPLTPSSRLFIRPEMNQIIHLVVGGTYTIDIEAVKSEVLNSVMMKLPRFTSILITDSNGVPRWRRTEVDIEQHVIVVQDRVGQDEGDDEDDVNDYMADLAVGSPLAVDKPLWEIDGTGEPDSDSAFCRVWLTLLPETRFRIHLLMAHNCALVRLHHALGDGISLMPVLLSLFRRVDEPSLPATAGAVSIERRTQVRSDMKKKVWEFFKAVWLTLVYLMGFVMRALWVSDARTAVSGGDGVELWPRKLATAKLKLGDMKAVKKAVFGATINDVLFGVISSGISKYLDIRTPKGLPEGLQLTGLAMVNLRKQSGLQDPKTMMSGNSGSSLVNKFGVMLLPIYYHQMGSDPLHHVKIAKSMIEKKKLSLEAHLSYHIGDLVMSMFGAKAASWLNYRVVCNTTFTISNVIGPQEDISFVGNPVKFLRVTNTALPHAITMHMLSYAGRADMQILVAKDIIPDPKILAKCFEDSLLEMKEAAEALKIV